MHVPPSLTTTDLAHVDRSEETVCDLADRLQTGTYGNMRVFDILLSPAYADRSEGAYAENHAFLDFFY